jgi:hypothetical protein
MGRVGETAFLKDIVSEVSEKTGYSKEKVEANYFALLDTIKQMTKEEDVSTIYIPKIGSMYFKPLKFKHYLENVKDKEKSPIPAMASRSKRLVEDLTGVYHRHMKRSKMSNLYFNKGFSKKQIEEHQNKAYDKLKESQDYR